MGDTYRNLLTPAQRASRKLELEKLESLAEQIHARIDTLRAEIAQREYSIHDPHWDDEVTPVRPSRWKK